MKRQATTSSDSESDSSDDDFGPSMPTGLNQAEENVDQEVSAVKVQKKMKKKKKKTKFEQVSDDNVRSLC